MSSDFAVEANEMLQSAVKALDYRRKMQRYKLHEVNCNINRYNINDLINKYHDMGNNKSNNNDHNVEESNTYDTILRKLNTLSHNLEEMQNKMGKLDTASKFTLANAQQQQQQPSVLSALSWEKMKEYCRVEIVQLERELLMMSSDWKDRFEYAHSQNKQAQAILQKQLDDVAMKTKINVKEQLESKEWTERKLRNITTQLDNQKREIKEVQMNLSQQEQRTSDALQHQIKDVLLQLHTVEHNQQRELSTVRSEMSQKIAELSNSIKKASEQYVEEYLKAHNKRENVIIDENNFSSKVSANNDKHDVLYSNEVRALHRQMQLLKEVTANNVHQVEEGMESTKLEQMKTNKVIQECKVKVMAHDERVEGLEELIHSEVNRMNVLQRKNDSQCEQVEVCHERIAQMSKDVHHVTSALGKVQTTVEQNTKQMHQAVEHVESLQSLYDTLLKRLNSMQNDYNIKTAQEKNFMNKDDVISEIDLSIRQMLRNEKEKTLVELEDRISHSCNAIREDCGKQLNKCTQTYNTLLQEQIEAVTNDMNGEINKLKTNELAIWHQQLDEISLECLNHHKVMESKLLQLEHKLTAELENVNNSHKNKQSTFETRLESKLNEWQESIRVEQEELQAEQTKMKNKLDKCMSSIKDQRDNTMNNLNETLTKEVVQEITNNIINNKISALQSKFDLSLQSLQNNQDDKLEHHLNQLQISMNDITRKQRELEEYKIDMQSKIQQCQLEIGNIKEEVVLYTKDKHNVENNKNNNNNIENVISTTSSVEITNMNNKISDLEKCVSEISNRLSEYVAQANAQHTQSCKKIEHMEQSVKLMQQHVSQVQNKIETLSKPLQTKELMELFKDNLIMELQNYIDGKIDAISHRQTSKLSSSPAPSQQARSKAGVVHHSSTSEEEEQCKYESTTKEQNTRYDTGSDKMANGEEQNKEYKTLQLLRDSVEMLSNELDSSHHSSSFNNNDHDVDDAWSENNVKYDSRTAAKEENVLNKRVADTFNDSNDNSSSISEVSTIDVNGGGADKLTSVSSSVPLMLFANKTKHDNYKMNTHYVNVKNGFNSNQESEEEEEEEEFIRKDKDNTSNAEHQDYKINEIILNSINKSKNDENETEELNNTNRSSVHALEHSTTITYSDDNTHTHRPRSLIISPPKSDSSSSHHSSHLESEAAEENKYVYYTIQKQEKEQQQQHDSFDESSLDDHEDLQTHEESELEEQEYEEYQEEYEEERNEEEDEEKQEEEKKQQLNESNEPVEKNNYDDWDDDEDDGEEENNTDGDVNKEQNTITGNGSVNAELLEEESQMNEQILSKLEHKLNTSKHTEELHKLEETSSSSSSSSSSSLELPLGDEGNQEQCKDNAAENVMTSTHVDDNLHANSQVELPAAATTVTTTPTETKIKKYTDFDDSSTEL